MTADGMLIAGAGIGGLTAALALARQGIGVTLFDQAEKLEEAGAGIQLSPNAARVLIALGLADRLKPMIVEPAAIRLRFGAFRPRNRHDTARSRHAGALRRALLGDPSRRPAEGAA